MSGARREPATMMLVAGFTLPLTNDPSSTVSTVLYAPTALAT